MSDRKLLKNPYDNDISLIVPSVNFKLFTKLYKSLVDRCSNPKRVELLLKLDSTKNVQEFYNLADQSLFDFKILIYPQYHGRFSLHHFFNDLGAISSGSILWLLNDDATVVGGEDWYQALMRTRDVYRDNIYCVMVPFDKDEKGRGMIPTPAISREWYNLFGYVTAFPNYDRWLCELSKRVGRQVVLSKDQIIITMPKGHRVLSKQDRKDIFYPRFEKVLKKIKKKISL